MKNLLVLVLLLFCMSALFGCHNSPDSHSKAKSVYTYEELSEMPAKELLDLFVQNGLVISNELKTSFTTEELQTLFKDNFHIWHTGMSLMSYTEYIDLAEQTKEIYNKITEPKN